MSRALQSEKRFYVIVGDGPMSDTILHIIDSYRIMSANIEYTTDGNIPCIDTTEFGTVCHIDSEARIQGAMSAITSKGLRYIGYVNGTDHILSIGSNGYLGIPVKTSKILIRDGMWEVCYPHITLAPPMGANKFNDFKSIIGVPINYSISELMKTNSTYSHSVLIDQEEHHVTRLVLNGQKPFIAKKEMVGLRGNTYDEIIGYPVIM